MQTSPHMPNKALSIPRVIGANNFLQTRRPPGDPLQPRQATARRESTHRWMQRPQSTHGWGLGDQHNIHKHCTKAGYTIGSPTLLHDRVPRHSSREQSCANSPDHIGGRLRNALPLPLRAPPLRSRPLRWRLRCSAGEDGVRKVHGHPELRLHADEMSGPRGVITIHGSHSQAILAERVNLEEVEARMRGPAEARSAPPVRKLPRHDWGWRPPEELEYILVLDHPEFREDRPPRRISSY